MEAKEKKVSVKAKKSTSSICLFVAAWVVTLIAVALLINNIIIFKNVLAQYVGQGYSAAEVMKQLIPSQLLPGIFEPLAVYGGIAAILFGIGIINQKASKCIALLTKDEATNTAPEENVSEDNAADVKADEQTETNE